MNIRRFGQTTKKPITPDLTPLIDVVFLLLIFFMVATTFDDFGGMTIDLPSSNSSISDVKFDKISVLLDKDNEIKIKKTINGTTSMEKSNLDNLNIKLMDLIKKSKDKRVGVVADKGIDYGKVVEIMSIAKNAGAISLDIETIKE